jgi:aerobic-type carbon monoxide dehydrogenase small subunit (CoxS/CutS family)
MPSRAQIAEHISANICHCGTYPRMYVLIAFCCDALGPLMALGG